MPAVYGIAIQRGALPYIMFNFPLTPTSIRKEFPSMSNVYNVAGPSSQQGVQRVADLYGIAPPDYIIEGTTGWQRHLSDGYTLTGLEAIQTLESILKQYANLNALAAQQNTQPYDLEFFDYFSNSFWAVVPVGPQGFYQDASKPLLTNYRFRLSATRPLDGPTVALGEADALLQVFGTPAVQAAANAVTSIAGLANLYAPAVRATASAAVSAVETIV
jgi:hypothetical protein